MHLFIDSMYVINGMKEARLVGRKLIRSTCRAEWERLRVLLDSRVGEVRVEHVRSHPKDKGTGEDVEWDDMSFPQRLNSAADEIAEGGRELESVRYDFPIGEVEHVLFSQGSRVTGDPRKFLVKQSRKQWEGLWGGEGSTLDVMMSW